MIYLDYAATSPMSEVALQSYMTTAKNYYGNSASLHDEGGKAHYFLEQARKVIARKLNVSTDSIIFTGSGTEGNILAIQMLARHSNRGKHIITTQAEHTSVHVAMNSLQQIGYEITKLPLQANGAVSLDDLRDAIRKETALISIQHVNSEIGSIQPIEQIVKLANDHNIFLHVDCVQSFCKLDISSFAKLVDGITVSAHKIGGPKGCGAIYMNPKLNVQSLIPGVTHERGLRGGTIDTPSIVAFAAAVENYYYDIAYCEKLRTYIVEHLPAGFQLIQCAHQLPSISSLFCENYEGQYIMLKLNEAGICISTGSACDVRGDIGTKAVLAMGHSVYEARKFFRVSFSTETTQQQIEALVDGLKRLG